MTFYDNAKYHKLDVKKTDVTKGSLDVKTSSSNLPVVQEEGNITRSENGGDRVNQLDSTLNMLEPSQHSGQVLFDHANDVDKLMQQQFLTS
jgi:primase-polymerase (primpol)-like protein